MHVLRIMSIFKLSFHAMVPSSFIAQLIDRTDIADFIGKHVKLKLSGANHHGLCPFHQEKSPSFTVSRSKKFFHCFGCGAHGSVIGFAIDHLGMNFVEAVEHVAASQGLEVPKEGEALPRHDYVGALKIMREASAHYREQVGRHHQAMAYIKERGLTDEAIQRFSIGYAPSDRQGLRKSRIENYNASNLLEVGLVSDERGRHDLFRDRLIFPIHDRKGNVIGLGGRAIGDGVQPKYLNTPETFLFNKGRELYGQHIAAHAIAEAEYAVVVEGYMDVVAMYQHGIENAVATLGTATTARQAERLLSLTNFVVFCFDGDAAGRKAATKALGEVLPIIKDGQEVRFMFLPDGDDPDDFLRKNGVSQFHALMDKATSLVDYVITLSKVDCDIHSTLGVTAFLQRATGYFAKMSLAPITVALAKKKLSDLSGLDKDDLSSIMLSSPDHAREKNQKNQRPLLRNERSSLGIMDRQILRCLLSQSAISKTTMLRCLSADKLSHIRPILEALNAGHSPVALTEILTDPRLIHLCAELMGESMDWSTFDAESELISILNIFETERAKDELSTLMEKISSGGRANLSDGERARYLELLKNTQHRNR